MAPIGWCSWSVICVSICLASAALATSEVSATLGDLCSNKKVSIEAIHDARNLVNEIKSSSEDHCAPYRNAILELDPILEAVQSGRANDADFIKLVADYHRSYIENGKDRKTTDKIPSSLATFFISLCLQVSAELKMTLINNLESDTRQYVDSGDRELVEFLDKFGQVFIDSESAIRDFDDLILVDDLQTATGEAPTKMVIKTKTSKMIRRLISACNNRFRPIYERLIMPVVRLSNLGFNFQGEILKYEMEELKTSPFVRRWYVIVQTCEAFRSMEVFEASDEVLNGNSKAFVFVGPEEAAELRKSQPSLQVDDKEQGEEAIEYHPVTSHKDELWIMGQAELSKLVSQYNPNTSEADRIKGRIVRKLFGYFKEMVKSGKILMFTSDVIKSRLSGKPSLTSVNEDMIRQIDNMVEEDKTQAGEKSDGAVAGFQKGPLPYPDRISYIRPRIEDGTRTRTKLWNFSVERVLPNKINLLFWCLGLMGIVLLIFGLSMSG